MCLFACPAPPPSSTLAHILAPFTWGLPFVLQWILTTANEFSVEPTGWECGLHVSVSFYRCTIRRHRFSHAQVCQRAQGGARRGLPAVGAAVARHVVAGRRTAGQRQSSTPPSLALGAHAPKFVRTHVVFGLVSWVCIPGRRYHATTSAPHLAASSRRVSPAKPHLRTGAACLVFHSTQTMEPAAEPSQSLT